MDEAYLKNADTPIAFLIVYNQARENDKRKI